MRVLIGFEESGVVRNAFLEKGFDAWSCDIQAARDRSYKHIEKDIYRALSQTWDLIIIHPPCTALALSGNRWYGKGMPLNHKRLEALKWTVSLWHYCTTRCPLVALENPVGVLSRENTMPQPSYIQPWQFGHGETKKTGLWLHKLPPLKPTNIVSGRENRIWKMAEGPERARLRSETYQGVANAMADQWGSYIKG